MPGSRAAAARTGALQLFPVASPGNFPYGVTTGPDGAVWFTLLRSGQVGRIDPAGNVKEFALPGFSSPAGIVTGPDGNLWIAESGDDYIGRLTPQGSLTQFPLPSGTEPQSIAAGPDGDLWFTGEVGNVIGRITTSGNVTLFPVTTPNSSPFAITAGADGALWFTEDGVGKIGRITTSGQVTEYPLQSSAVEPAGIATGPDGNVWFTENGGRGNLVGSIGPSGVTRIYRLPSTGTHPRAITTGPDGNLWYVGYNGLVGRITPTGTVTQFAKLSPSLYGIAPGNGGLWFSAGQANEIGKIAIQGATLLRRVSVVASGFSPASLSLPLGGTVSWGNYGPTAIAVADTTGLGLFDSGSLTPVSFFQTTLSAAGSFAYGDLLAPAHTGVLEVAPTATPSSGSTNTPFAVTWATTPPTVSREFDVEIGYCSTAPCTPTLEAWQTGVTATSATFSSTNPAWQGPGIYLFESRLRDTSSGATSGWSPPATVTVTP